MNIPEGIPQVLSVGQCARALHLGEETIKRALEAGALAGWRLVEGRGWRYTTPQALAEFADRRGLTVYWSELV